MKQHVVLRGVLHNKPLINVLLTDLDSTCSCLSTVHIDCCFLQTDRLPWTPRSQSSVALSLELTAGWMGNKPGEPSHEETGNVFPTKSFPKVGLLQLKDPMCVLWQHLVVRKYSAKKLRIYLSGRSLCSWLYCPFSFICGGKK